VRLAEPERYCIADEKDIESLRPDYMLQVFNRSEFFWVRLLSLYKDPARDPMDWRLVGRVESTLAPGKPY
jgi:hypothetical protein